jgi:Spy/CpxP family protein refolding chaperone
MSTASITRRPASFVVAAGGAAAAVVVAFAVALSQHSGPSIAPTEPIQVHKDAHHAGGWHPTTSGDRVMVGE